MGEEACRRGRRDLQVYPLKKSTQRSSHQDIDHRHCKGDPTLERTSEKLCQGDSGSISGNWGSKGSSRGKDFSGRGKEKFHSTTKSTDTSVQRSGAFAKVLAGEMKYRRFENMEGDHGRSKYRKKNSSWLGDSGYNKTLEGFAEEFNRLDPDGPSLKTTVEGGSRN